MSQFNAGDVVSITIDQHNLTIKIEDASKSESISARIEQSDSNDYKVGQICDFDRSLFKDKIDKSS